MYSSFVNGKVNFTKMEEAWSSLDPVAPVVNLYLIIPWVDLCFLQKFLEEVYVAAMYIKCTWLYKGLCNVVDDIVGQPEAIVKSEEAAAQY